MTIDEIKMHDDTENSNNNEDSDLRKLGHLPRKSIFTNDCSPHFLEPHNEHRPRTNQPESIGNILRRVLGLKKKKKEERPEGYIPDEQLDWMLEKNEDELEEADEIELSDDEDWLTEDERKGRGTWSHGEGSGAFGGRG